MTTWQDIGTEERPVRIQRKRTKGWKMPPNTVVVSRPSKFGNPFPLSELTAETAVAMFRYAISKTLRANPDALEELRGKNLACWCRLDQPCHADILLELANRPSPPSKEGE